MSRRDYLYDPTQTPFDPKASGFHANNALCLAAASNLVYEENEPLIQDTVKTWGFDKFTFIRAEDKKHLIDTQAFLCGNADALLLVFRGTESRDLKDWFTDFRLKPVAGPGGNGKVHHGFSLAVNAAWPQIQAALGQHRDNRQAIWVSGHSLGGALAILAVARLQMEERISVQGLYSFGQPRTGDWTFAGAFNESFPSLAVRFVNNNDLVPHLPPTGPIWRYWHVKRLLYIDASGDLHPSMPVSRWLVEGTKGMLQDYGKLGPDVLKDHDMDLYVQHIRRHALAGK